MTLRRLIRTHKDSLPGVNGGGDGIIVADFDGTLGVKAVAEVLSPS